MSVKDIDQDLCDSARTLSLYVIDLLRSGVALQGEDKAYAEIGIKTIETLLADSAKVIEELRERMHAEQKKMKVLEWKHGRFQALVAPVRCLPPEILSRILLLTLQNDGEFRNSNSFHGCWNSATIDYATVCAHWRRVVYSTPQLWAAFSVKVNQEHDNDLPDTFGRFLSRSANATLDIQLFLHGSGRSILATLSILFDVRHRWRRLALWGLYEALMPFLVTLRERPGHPWMKTLEIHLDHENRSYETRLLDGMIDNMKESLQFTSEVSILASGNTISASVPYSSFSKITKIDLALTVDSMCVVLRMTQGTLVSAKLAVNKGANTLYRVDVGAEMSRVEEIHRGGKISLPHLRELVFTIEYHKDHARISYLQTRALWNSISFLPLLQDLRLEYRTRVGLVGDSLDTIILLFKNAHDSVLETLALINVLFGDSDIIRILQAAPKLKYLDLQETSGVREWPAIFTRELFESMTFGAALGPEGERLVPDLKRIRLRFPDACTPIEYSSLVAMFDSRHGILLTGVVFPGSKVIG
ncbi:hypothetical protein VNI00_009219 [Paramarasmius palmivorus]|uniref:F-box domain-containing protein n=1 Tax=Paramarasmius palmivorus TaxID=297713 RepID=A0AAW0CNW5_9AGAR